MEVVTANHILVHIDALTLLLTHSTVGTITVKMLWTNLFLFLITLGRAHCAETANSTGINYRAVAYYVNW
jgi:hypothetical protein